MGRAATRGGRRGKDSRAVAWRGRQCGEISNAGRTVTRVYGAGRTAAWGRQKHREHSSTGGWQRREGGGAGGQQRGEDGGVGRATALGERERGVEHLQVQRKDCSFDCQGMCTLNVLDVFKPYLI